VVAVGAVDAGKPVSQDAALQVLAKGCFGVRGHATAVLMVPGRRGEVCLEVFADHPVQQRGGRAVWTVDAGVGGR
jgi:hypothetical protein